jgi:hypothetical protein
MTTLGQLLRQQGIELALDGQDEPADSALRSLFARDCPAIESDADGSSRLRLSDQNDQIVLTTDDELVVVHGRFGQDRFDLANKSVRARTTAKAANQLTKLRLWFAVTDGLKQAHAVGKPGKPATLTEWMQQHEEEAQRLQRQVDAMGLAAEKTHNLSALVFEPALLSEFRQREVPFRTAITAYHVADIMRLHILSEAAKRITRKARFDPQERDQYLARKDKLSQRAVQLYTTARDCFNQVGASSLVNHCEEMIAGYASSTKAAAPSDSRVRPELLPTIGMLAAAHENSSWQKLLEPADTTLQNTVRAINGMADEKMRGNLEAHFAAHVVSIARRLPSPADVVRLLSKVEELKSVVAADTHINPARIDRYRGLILRERSDTLPLLGRTTG